jgi:hypothetical protein
MIQGGTRHVIQVGNQYPAYFSKVARHFRTVLVLDMQDPNQVYSALVAQEDFILVNRMNKHHIPEKLHWLSIWLLYFDKLSFGHNHIS